VNERCGNSMGSCEDECFLFSESHGQIRNKTSTLKATAILGIDACMIHQLVSNYRADGRTLESDSFREAGVYVALNVKQVSIGSKLNRGFNTRLSVLPIQNSSIQQTYTYLNDLLHI